MRRFAFAMLGLSLLAGGCKKKEKEKPAVCREIVAGPQAKEVSAGEIPFDIWFLIMLENFNRDAMLVKRPEQDCTGREIRKSELSEEATKCLVGSSPPKRLADRPLVEEDLMITEADEGQLLVWVKTTHYENGEAEGPIAVAEFAKRGVLIVSVGTLRTHTDKAAMHLEPLMFPPKEGEEEEGPRQGKVLVIESRRCDKENPDKCDRLTKLVPLIDNKFLEKPLLDAKEECLGPPVFNMFRELEVTLPDQKIRKFEMARSIDYTDGNVVVAEQMLIKDRDPKEPDTPPVVFRKANVDRELTVLDDGLKTSEGLWDKMVAEHGSVMYEAEKPAGP